MKPLIRVILLLSFFASQQVSGQNEPIYFGEFWGEVDPVEEIAAGEQEANEARVKAILEDAVYAFSGMVYGFTFRYVPVDFRREVAEELEIAPAAEIPWGDPGLSVVESSFVNGRQRLLIRYITHPEQSSWIEYWNSNVFPASSGYAEGNLLLGKREKQAAIERAIREAIREYLKPREANKPREISGMFAFDSVPRIIIDEGSYKAIVSVKLDIREVVPYKVF